VNWRTRIISAAGAAGIALLTTFAPASAQAGGSGGDFMTACFAHSNVEGAFGTMHHLAGNYWDLHGPKYETGAGTWDGVFVTPVGFQDPGGCGPQGSGSSAGGVICFQHSSIFIGYTQNTTNYDDTNGGGNSVTIYAPQWLENPYGVAPADGGYAEGKCT